MVWALAGSGRVLSVSHSGPYGTHVIVRGRKGNDWLFAHLSAVSVRVGQVVSNGARIGRTGATGNATGDHLHLERAKGAWRYGNVRRPPVYDY